MTKPIFIWPKYFNIYAVHGFQIVWDRVIKTIKEYVFELLIQLKMEVMLDAFNVQYGLLIWYIMLLFVYAAIFLYLQIKKLRSSLIDLNVECRLFFFCRKKMQAQLLIWIFLLLFTISLKFDFIMMIGWLITTNNFLFNNNIFAGYIKTKKILFRLLNNKFVIGINHKDLIYTFEQQIRDRHQSYHAHTFDHLSAEKKI